MTAELPACRNCGTVLEDTYCGACGQRGKEVRRPVIGLVQDVIVDTLAIDGKLLRSIRMLLTGPGRLARAYIDGRRASHTAPFRFYLFTSLVFFLALFASLNETVSPVTVTGPDDETVSTDVDSSEPAAPAPADDPVEPGDVAAEEDEDRSVKIELNLDDSDAPDWLKQLGQRMEANIEKLQDDPRLFMAQTRETVPRILLLAPVLYGLLLALVYVYRRRFLFYDHFVTSLYMHAALYAYLGLSFGLSQLPAPLDFLGGGILLWALIQPYAVLRQVYGSNWFSVVVKGTAINLIYWTFVSVLISLGLGYSLYTS